MKQPGKYRMRNLCLLLLVAAALFSCATGNSAREDCSKISMSYNDLLRWHRFEDAGPYIADSIAEEYRQRVEMAKNVKFADYRLVNFSFDEKKKEASIKIEIDYYTNSSPKLRTVVDEQRWIYEGEDGKGAWKLISLLPEFH